MSVEKTVGCNHSGQDETDRPHRAAVAAFASRIRTYLQFHQQLGIDSYPLTSGLREFLAEKGGKLHPAALSRRIVPSFPPSPSVPSVTPQSTGAGEPLDRLALLSRDIEECSLCSWSSTRQGQVLGAGTAASRLMIIGDSSRQTGEFSPTTLFGVAEDAMLWNMIRAIGLVPEEVYVTNAVKCCPSLEPQPESESALGCLSLLRREIALIRPHIICAMGETAAHAVLGGSEPVVRLRGRFHPYKFDEETGGRIQVMVTFHPRFLLECGDFKKAAWKDLQMIQRQLQAR